MTDPTMGRSVFDPAPGPSLRRPTGEPAAVRHFICFHDPEALGYDFRDVAGFHVLTRKKIRDLEGDVVWLIGRDSSGSDYYLVFRFRIERVWTSEGWIHLAARKGDRFSPPRRISGKPWFLRYKDAIRGLSHGLQRVKDDIVLRGLKEELADRDKAPARAARSETLGITEIRVRHTMCFGNCPVYSYALRADGTADYEGEAFVRKTGRYRGKVPRGTFTRMARLVSSVDFRALQDNYAAPMTDMASVITTVTGDGWSKTVLNYGNAGPAKLRRLEQALDRCCTRIRWRKRPSRGA